MLTWHSSCTEWRSGSTRFQATVYLGVNQSADQTQRLPWPVWRRSMTMSFKAGMIVSLLILSSSLLYHWIFLAISPLYIGYREGVWPFGACLDQDSMQNSTTSNHLHICSTQRLILSCNFPLIDTCTATAQMEEYNVPICFDYRYSYSMCTTSITSIIVRSRIIM